MSERHETAIVGGGQAGLAMSHHLSRLGRPHVILERGRVGERWRSERWDSLMFQFPNWSLRLPGQAYDGGDPDGFATRDEVMAFIGRYRGAIRAPGRRVPVVRPGASGCQIVEDLLAAGRRVYLSAGRHRRYPRRYRGRDM